MVARSGGNGGGVGPVVHMYMLHVNAATFDSIGDEDMIQLLRILIEKEGVSFDGVNSSYLVRFGQNVLQRCKCGTRLNVFVKVACNHNVGVGVLRQNRSNKSLVITFSKQHALG